MGYRSIAEFAIYLQIMKGETKTHEFRVDKYGFLQPFCDFVRYLPILLISLLLKINFYIKASFNEFNAFYAFKMNDLMKNMEMIMLALLCYITRKCASLGLRMKFKTLFMSDFDLLLFLNICPSNSWSLGV